MSWVQGRAGQLGAQVRRLDSQLLASALTLHMLASLAWQLAVARTAGCPDVFPGDDTVVRYASVYCTIVL